MDISLIVGLVGIISTVTMIIVGLIKLPNEKRKIDADAAKSFAEAAKLSEEAAAFSAKRAASSADEFEEYKQKAEEDIHLLKIEIESLKANVKERDEKLEFLMCQLDDVQDWAERLVHQVISLGGDPVKIRKRKAV